MNKVHLRDLPVGSIVLTNDYGKDLVVEKMDLPQYKSPVWVHTIPEDGIIGATEKLSSRKLELCGYHVIKGDGFEDKFTTNESILKRVMEARPEIYEKLPTETTIVSRQELSLNERMTNAIEKASNNKTNKCNDKDLER